MSSHFFVLKTFVTGMHTMPLSVRAHQSLKSLAEPALWKSLRKSREIGEIIHLVIWLVAFNILTSTLSADSIFLTLTSYLWLQNINT